MKNRMVAVGLILVSISAFAGADGLEGKSFCRKVVSDGSFGVPRGEGRHCLSFRDGVVIDDANTFFGNPPERFIYTLKGRVVSFGTSKLVVSRDFSDLVMVFGSANEGVVFE